MTPDGESAIGVYAPRNERSANHQPSAPKRRDTIMVKSDLPFGSEFSPNQIELIRVLEIVAQNSGDSAGLERSLQAAFFTRGSTNETNQAKLAMNCRLALAAYGLIDADFGLSDMARSLLALKEDRQALYREFARHILLNLKGLPVIQTAQDLQSRRETLNLQSLRLALDERGIKLPRGSKTMSTMRLWLELAGVIKSREWEIDERVLQAILGTSSAEIDRLAMFTPEQRAFLKTLARLPAGQSYTASEVERLAAATYGIRFNEKALPRTVLVPIRDAGYIELQKGTAGRGGKSFRLTLTDKLAADLIEPLIKGLEQQVVADLRPLLRKPLNEILVDVASGDRHVKGLALEALAFYLMRLVDLQYVATRLRGEKTGGAEVDLIFEGARLLFSRWQIQCKNTQSVTLDDVAKEVGLTIQLKSNVVVVVSTGRIGAEARRYAHTVMRDTYLNIVLIDRKDLELIAESPPLIAEILNRDAARAMDIKKLDL